MSSTPKMTSNESRDDLFLTRPTESMFTDENGPRQLATALFLASPSRARQAALDIHEKLALSGDFEHADLWELVLREIDYLAARTSDPALTSPSRIAELPISALGTPRQLPSYEDLALAP